MLSRRLFLAGSAAGLAIPPVRAADGWRATVNLDGGTFVFDAAAAEDLGDFTGTGLVQRCLRVTRSDCPLVVYFRPDRDGARGEVVFELGDLWASGPRGLGPYRVEIANGGATVAAVEVPRHFWFARWRWQSAPRPVVAQPADLIAQGLLPPYHTQSAKGLPSAPEPTEKGAALGLNGSLFQGPMSLAGIEPHMEATGERDEIGLITEAQGRFVSTGDKQALAHLRAQAEAAGTLPWHIRDSHTAAPVDLDHYGEMSWYPDGKAGKPHIELGQSGIGIDAAHQPALAYVPYLLTGDPYHLEDLQFAANFNRGQLPPPYRLSIPQTRAFAWSLRTLAQAAKVTPAQVPRWLLPRATWQRDLDRTRDWFTREFVQSAEPLKRNFHITDSPNNSRDEGPTTPEGTWTAPWMDEFLAATLGWLVIMGDADWRPAFLWKLENTLARTSGRSGWVRAYATPYRIILRPDKASPYVTSWAEAWALTSRLQNWPKTDPDALQGKDLTYPIYTRAVLALAVHLGVEAAKPNLAWLERELSRRGAAIPARWQIG